MNVQFNHVLITSFKQYLDHNLCNGAQAYQNVSGALYPQTNPSVQGNVWAAPFKEWVADSCVSGAEIITGALNSSGQLLTRDSGVVFDFLNGRVICPQKYRGNLTGVYARKEYNIYTSNEDEIDWWLENVYKANKNITYTPTGAMEGRFAAPCIILTNARAHNDPWALGGERNSINTIRGYVISPTLKPFLTEGVNSYLNDLAQYSFPLLPFGSAPYTASGDLKSGYYCYDDLCAQFGSAGAYIQNVHNLRVSQKANNTTTYSVSIAEFDTSVVRVPRLTP